MTDTIRPDSIADFNAVGRTTGTKADLAGMEFLIHCPPDLPPRSRIVSLCGITDWGDGASPQKDGWFISDFYLFHHLLRPRDPLSTNQIWLTSESPDDLVRKYTEYAHGDPHGERRVVLETQLLDEISSAGNLRVVARKDLLERFLNTVREQALIAERQSEQLVIMIFGHGDAVTSGVLVGGEGDSENTPRLFMRNISRLLPSDLSVTLLITSCYSGGWLVCPDLSRSSRCLNVTGIAAAGEEKESHSWPVSRSIGRASGSLAASAILASLIKVEDEVSQELEEISPHPTYIEFSHSIFKTIKAMHFFGEEQRIHFSAEDDEWEMNYQSRLGLPLASYKTRWESLREIPATAPSEGDAGEALLPRTGNARQCGRLQVLAREYFAANPGPDNAGPNVAFHNALRFILSGRTDSAKEELSRLFDIVTYRLGSMHEADYLRTQMEIEFPSIFDVDIYEWKKANWLEFTAQDRAEKEHIQSKIRRLIQQRRLLTHPIGGGLSYTKPINYLALALLESGLPWEEIDNRIKNASLQKVAWYRSVYKAWRGKGVVKNEAVITRRRAFLETVKRMGWKITERSESW
ncbi:hypothetical protein BDV23DRAFT_182700 [Aspergillus alliaceus]|uniref:Uncharacterized protein n=1 Tax=Petromyces alliaceus TaxID=209559 RepID=A0A5N7CAJ6_PETAA|nr:hypothetical protein BDV23DRAFT_182700 [Aspergillus alliaceus]